MPVLADGKASHRSHLHFAYTDLQRGVSNGRFKLIEYAVNGTRTTQLFDCQTDPWELNNLADDPVFAETKVPLRHELLRWRTELCDWEDDFWETYEKEEKNEYE